MFFSPVMLWIGLKQNTSNSFECQRSLKALGALLAFGYCSIIKNSFLKTPKDATLGIVKKLEDLEVNFTWNFQPHSNILIVNNAKNVECFHKVRVKKLRTLNKNEKKNSVQTEAKQWVISKTFYKIDTRELY